MGPLPPGAGMPPGGGPQMNPQIAAMLQARMAQQNALGGGAPMPNVGMAKGGAVDDGDADDAPKKKSGRRFGAKEAAAEDIPEAKKKGGAIKRRKPKAPKLAVPMTPGGDASDQGPPPDVLAALSGAGGAAPGPAGPAPAGPPPPGPPPPGMKKGGNFIQAAIKKPGALHKDLGVPQGKKIPEKKLAAAAKKSGKVGQRARFAETLKGLRKNKGGKCEKMAAGGAMKVRRGFPNVNPAPKGKYAQGGKIRGVGAATKGTRFQGIF
jgi:hypothetical protein